jgi:hypothetical protein
MLFILSNIPKETSYAYKLATFTIKTRPNPADSYRHVVEAFRRLRSRKIWKENVKGGVYVVEVKHNLTGWHVHIHAIILARFIPQRLLSKAWQAVSGSPIMDIRQAPNRGVITYLTTYLTKTQLSSADQLIANEALFGTRLFSVFGAAYQINRTFKAPPFLCPVCGESDWMAERALDRGFSIESLVPS